MKETTVTFNSIYNGIQYTMDARQMILIDNQGKYYMQHSYLPDFCIRIDDTTYTNLKEIVKHL